MEFKELNNLLDKAINLQKKQRRRTVYLVLLLATIGALLFFTSNFFTAKTVTEKIQSDSTITNPIYKNVVKKQNEEISLIIENYFQFRANKNLAETSKYYADTTFDYFFSYKSVNNESNQIKLSRKQVINIDKVDFNKKENRAFDFTDILSISNNPNENSNTIVFVKGKQFTGTKIEDSIIEIHLNYKSKKIYSLRSYLAVNRQ